MSYPEKHDAMVLLRVWMRLHGEVDKLNEAVGEIFGRSPETPFFETTWGLFDAYTEALSAQLGDSAGWLEWFAFDNAMGAKKSRAGYRNDNGRPIKNLDDLWWLIEQARTRDV